MGNLHTHHVGRSGDQCICTPWVNAAAAKPLGLCTDDSLLLPVLLSVLLTVCQ